MRKSILSAAALTLIGTSALAADLPSRRPAVFTVTETVESQPWRYVGVNVGTNLWNDGPRTWTGGLVAGFEVNSFVGIEAAYDYRDSDLGNAHRATINVLPQYRIGNLVPYALVGVGYEWSNFRGDNAIYNVGGGVRFDVTKHVQLDVRYRYTNTFDRDAVLLRKGDSAVTAGVNYRF